MPGCVRLTSRWFTAGRKARFSGAGDPAERRRDCLANSAANRAPSISSWLRGRRRVASPWPPTVCPSRPASWESCPHEAPRARTASTIVPGISASRRRARLSVMRAGLGNRHDALRSVPTPWCSCRSGSSRSAAIASRPPSRRSGELFYCGNFGLMLLDNVGAPLRALLATMCRVTMMRGAQSAGLSRTRRLRGSASSMGSGRTCATFS